MVGIPPQVFVLAAASGRNRDRPRVVFRAVCVKAQASDFKAAEVFLKWPKYFLWQTGQTTPNNCMTVRFGAVGLPYLVENYCSESSELAHRVENYFSEASGLAHRVVKFCQDAKNFLRKT